MNYFFMIRFSYSVNSLNYLEIFSKMLSLTEVCDFIIYKITEECELAPNQLED